MNESHVRALRPQRDQSDQALDTEERLSVARTLMAQGPAYAAVDEDGVFALGGIQDVWDGRGMCWALLAEDSGSRLVVLTRAIRRYLDGLHYRRLEMYVDAQFAAGRRWAEMLGFDNETPQAMAGFLPNGNAAYMYGRVRQWHG